MRKLAIDVRAGEHAVCRLPVDAALPAALFDGPGLVSVSRTEHELSVVCPAERAPADAQHFAGGWRWLAVRGPLEFTLTGIMAALAGELAAAGISLFALSTYDTDHILVQQDDLLRAVQALREAGHQVPLEES